MVIVGSKVECSQSSKPGQLDLHAQSSRARKTRVTCGVRSNANSATVAASLDEKENSCLNVELSYQKIALVQCSASATAAAAEWLFYYLPQLQASDLLLLNTSNGITLIAADTSPFLHTYIKRP